MGLDGGDGLWRHCIVGILESVVYTTFLSATTSEDRSESFDGPQLCIEWSDQYLDTDLMKDYRC